MSVLVVAAHPDDEVLGAGGILPLVGATQDTHILILGEGISSRYETRDRVTRKELEALEECARNAAHILGAQSVSFGGLPDNRFDQVALLDVIKVVEVAVAQYAPTIIYTHHPGDLNIDHLVTFRAVLTATRPMRDCPVQEIYAFEVPSSTEWAFQQFQPAFRPNTFVEISTTLETKIQAMQAYESESRAFPHPRSPDALRAIAKRWASVVGMEAAEAFELIRKLTR